MAAWPGIFLSCIRPGLRYETVSTQARGSRRLRRCNAVDAIRVGVVIRSLRGGSYARGRGHYGNDTEFTERHGRRKRQEA